MQRAFPARADEGTVVAARASLRREEETMDEESVRCAGFGTRKRAGELLGVALRSAGVVDPVLLGIPRGGLTVAAAAARVVHGVLGVLAAKRFGAPDGSAWPIGAVAADGTAFVDGRLANASRTNHLYLDAAWRRAREEAVRCQALFRRLQGRTSLAGRDVVIVDDALVTGFSTGAAAASARASGARRVVVAAPVATAAARSRLRDAAERVICLAELPAPSIRSVYRNDPPIDVRTIMRSLRELGLRTFPHPDAQTFPAHSAAR
jgi:predicted phosphoribosyltransferase